MARDETVFGIHAVEAALERGAVSALWVAAGRRDKRLQRLLQAAAGKGVAVEERPRAELDGASGGGNHQGVLARVALAPARNEAFLEALLTSLDEPPFLLVLDGVQDPHNLGACLRSAAAAGVHAVVAPKDRACGLTPVVRKVSVGASERVPFVQVTNLARTLRTLTDAGLWLVGAAGEAEQAVFDAALTGPLALVLGAEEKGLRRLTREHCDQLVRIPMAGGIESLNVSVAAGVCLFEAVRQRR